MSVNMIVSRFLSTKTILVTGSNEGIGFYTALALAWQNHKVIMADKSDLSHSRTRIVNTTGNPKISAKFVDFTSLNSIRNFAQEVKNEEERLDVLINNVGVFCLGKERTVDGLQTTMQVNHFGPFLLTHLLSELLVKSGPSRVLFASSLGAFFHKLTIDNINNPEVTSWDSLSSLLIYYNSKLCNMIAANGFAQKLKKCNVTVNSFDPGMTATRLLWKNEFLRTPVNCFLQDPEMGAQSSVFLSTTSYVDGVSGKFFVNLKEHQQPRVTRDEKFCQEIWDVSECFVDLKKNERISSDDF